MERYWLTEWLRASLNVKRFTPVPIYPINPILQSPYIEEGQSNPSTTFLGNTVQSINIHKMLKITKLKSYGTIGPFNNIDSSRDCLLRSPSVDQGKYSLGVLVILKIFNRANTAIENLNLAMDYISNLQVCLRSLEIPQSATSECTETKEYF